MWRGVGEGGGVTGCKIIPLLDASKVKHAMFITMLESSGLLYVAGFQMLIHYNLLMRTAAQAQTNGRQDRQTGRDRGRKSRLGDINIAFGDQVSRNTVVVISSSLAMQFIIDH